MSKPHKMYAEKEDCIPGHIIFVDTETSFKSITPDITEHKFRLGWACYWNYRPGRGKNCQVWQELNTPEEFWSFVGRHSMDKTKLFIIGHNIGFDFLILQGPQAMQEMGYTRQMFYDEGLTTLVKFKRPKHQIYFISSTNHFPAALSKLGEQVGLPKMTVDFAQVDDKELSRYCRRDVEILVKTYEQYFHWLQENKFGSFRMTKASQALSVFRRRFMRHDILIHGDKDRSNQERQGYYGGRCECFRVGRLPVQPYYLLDVNSLYPSVMQNNWYPIKYLKKLNRPDIKWLVKLCKRFCVVAECLIDTDQPVYPLKGQKLLFPVGSFVTCLNTPEIVRAYAQGHLQQVKWAFIYQRGKIFMEYVTKLYHLKEKYTRTENKIYRLLTKDLMNSLYGKFGQMNDVWEPIGSTDQQDYLLTWCYDVQTGKYWKQRQLLGVIEEQVDQVPAMNTLIPIASHVTAWGRCMLWDIIQQAGRTHVFYCDTDSVLVDKIGYQQLASRIDPFRLGFLSLQGTYRRVTLYGPKDYEMDQVIRHKGVSSQAVPLGDASWECEVWPGLKTSIHTCKAGTYQVRKQVKTLKRKYDKGQIKRGGRVEPFQLVFPG